MVIFAMVPTLSMVSVPARLAPPAAMIDPRLAAPNWTVYFAPSVTAKLPATLTVVWTSTASPPLSTDRSRVVQLLETVTSSVRTTTSASGSSG